jgi:hypothetical protein
MKVAKEGKTMNCRSLHRQWHDRMLRVDLSKLPEDELERWCDQMARVDKTRLSAFELEQHERKMLTASRYMSAMRQAGRLIRVEAHGRAA